MKVALRSAPVIGVKITDTGIQPSSTPALSLKNTFTGGKSRFDDLLDIDLSQQSDGSIPVYNSQTDKYEVKPFTTTITSLDGGTF